MATEGERGVGRSSLHWLMLGSLVVTATGCGGSSSHAAVDASAVDGGVDGSSIDAARLDGGVLDAALADVAPSDAMPTDAAPSDAMPVDAALIDAMPADGAVIDAMPVDAAAPSAVLTASPSALLLGATLIGTQTAAGTITVRNTGTLTSGAITLTLAGTSPGEFQLVAASGGDCISGTTTLSGGASCTVQVRFAPTTSGSKSATLLAGATPGGTAVANLGGTGQAQAMLALPDLVQSGNVTIGSSGPEQAPQARNNGDFPSGPLSITLGGADADQWVLSAPVAGDCMVGATLAAHGACSIRLRFMPTTTGVHTATLTLSATPGGSPVCNLTGSGLP